MVKFVFGFEKNFNYKVEFSVFMVGVIVCLFGVEIVKLSEVVCFNEDRCFICYYVFKGDVDMLKLMLMDYLIYCLYKGMVCYWFVDMGFVCVDNSVWVYDDFYEECLFIKEFILFYGNDYEFFEV